MSDFPTRPVPANFRDAHINAEDYRTLYDRSIQDPNGFWAEMANAVKALRAGQSAAIPVYDFSVSLRAGAETLKPTGQTLIVDGTLVMSQPEMVALADACVYVRCPEVLRRARRERRDVLR